MPPLAIIRHLQEYMVLVLDTLPMWIAYGVEKHYWMLTININPYSGMSRRAGTLGLDG
jgi:hypothetical protein